MRPITNSLELAAARSRSNWMITPLVARNWRVCACACVRARVCVRAGSSQPAGQLHLARKLSVDERI